MKKIQAGPDATKQIPLCDKVAHLSLPWLKEKSCIHYQFLLWGELLQMRCILDGKESNSTREKVLNIFLIFSLYFSFNKQEINPSIPKPH